MLQINSGKLFTRPIERENELHGTLYGNLRLGHEKFVETAAGTLLDTDQFTHPVVLVYRLREIIEASASGPNVLVSHTITPYIRDFGAVVSFALNATCTPDYELTCRLLDNQPSLSTRIAPNKLLCRTFDREIWCQQGESQRLVEFTRDLIGLERRCFLAVMRAIRTYVTGIHRLADDIELAYTLLVASIESLAQAFDGHRATWTDYPEDKRRLIDAALQDAPDESATKVREALLCIEHSSLARRFRDFSLYHLEPDYFRADALTAIAPAGRSELPDLLAQAYRARSQYVHSLTELPRMLTLGHSFHETIQIDRIPWLTIAGLSRLARWVITTFIRRQSKVDTEAYDYQLERASVVQVPLAPQYWVGRTHNMLRKDGAQKLEGFLEQLSAHIQRVPGATVTDLREVLRAIEQELPRMKSEERRPFFALHNIFNFFAPEDMQYRFSDHALELIKIDFSNPSPEALLCELLIGSTARWELESHRDSHDLYFRRRSRKTGLRVPNLLEAALTLDLAERYRKSGSPESRKTARSYIALAVENWPGQERLRGFEMNFTDETIIDWSALLLGEASEKFDPL